MLSKKELHKLFFGKRVALIGNSDSLCYKNYGEEIDSHEIVVRMNRGIFALGTESHGSKIDVILYSKPTVFKGLIEPFEKLPELFKNCTYIHTYPANKNNKIFSKSTYFYPAIERYYFTLPVGFHKRSQKLLSTGACAIDLIIKCQPRQLNLYGFDWNKTDTFYQSVNYEITKDKHNFIVEKEYINWICWLESDIVKVIQ